MTYMIRFPVGDWSGDGHDKCEYYEVRSNYSAQELREVHFQAPKVVGFDIGDMCHDYEDDQLNADIADKLNAVGIDPKQYASYEHDGKYSMNLDSIINLWLAILEHIDPQVELMIIKSEAENINFYGFDDKGRHLETPGYGLFY